LRWRLVNGATSETLLRNADFALYLAKTEGRGTVRFFEPEMDARIQLRRTLKLDLWDATIRNEFEIYYQPLINLADDQITSFEALIRWNHPIRGWSRRPNASPSPRRPG
jgi:predicted signal transduction protein with EAL and GGDEF domain